MFVCTSCHSGRVCFGAVTQGQCEVCKNLAVGSRCNCKK